MRYITIDEFRIIGLAVEKIKSKEFTEEFKTMIEKNIGDTVDEIVVDGIRTLKYSNVILVGIEAIDEG